MADRKNKDDIDPEELIQESLPYVFNEKDMILRETNDISCKNLDVHIPLLGKKEKEVLAASLEINKENIINQWLKEEEMSSFYSAYPMDNFMKSDSLGYFGREKILEYALKELRGIEQEGKFIYITTRFLDFIRVHDIGIEELLKITIILKKCIIEHFIERDIRIINQITVIFDEISTNLSKNYNDIIIKLLNEYKNAIDNSNIITKTDIHGLISYANDAFCKLSGYEKQELIGKPHNIVRHPDMPKEVFKDLWSTIQDKKIWKGIIKNRKKNGGNYWVKATVVPILDENDKTIEYISIRTDITELKEAYKNLEEYNDALNEANLVLKIDTSGKIITANPRFLEKCGYDSYEIIGRSYMGEVFGDKRNDVMIPMLDKENIGELKSTISRKEVWKGNLKNISKTKGIFWTSTSIIPILDLNDQVTEYIVIQTDITELEDAQEELRKALDKQKELDVRKDDFLNIASHELRTPMTSVKGYISMILDGDAGEINPEVRTYLEQVYRSSDRLLNLINDMLDISKIESGKQEMTIEKVEIAGILKEVGDEIKSLFEKKNQKFINIIDFEEVWYNTDGDKLKQVLLNLLGNAHKFTPEGGSIILKSSSEGGELAICVEDTGIGISGFDIPKVFEKFGQVKNSLTRDISGTGLGLPISKAIIENLGGYITLESTPGIGSKFIVHMPHINSLKA